ncbi:DUF305 domain-containing protein [Nonomuraea harbinensis]|uniref:DUF305 domain-containing protein n=1 Tax=Nonomuraea harbinensis TaxID=1286938 RepID=A0ABW1C3I3_9ACTN|nr:DUF305 domain-containing protein [Nonomuraea harbinensis]
MRVRTRLLIAALALCVPASAACAPATGEPLPAAQAAYGEADIRFSQEMIPHHRQTIQLAGLAEGRADNLYVQDLGGRLIALEQADIDKMASWLREWKRKVPPDDAKVAHSMPGMLSAEQIKVLEGMSGAEFDKSWLTVLSRHLASGTEMAEKVLDQGRHQPTLRLAKEMIKNQRATIAEIAGLLA